MLKYWRKTFAGGCTEKRIDDIFMGKGHLEADVCAFSKNIYEATSNPYVDPIHSPQNHLSH
jgi:hypothetical protein